MPEYRATPGPSHIHPFASVLASDDLIFVTGLAAQGETVEQQMRTIVADLSDLLTGVGSSLSEIIHIREAVSDRAYIDDVVRLSRELLPDPKPAAGILQIAEFVHPELKVEIEVIAQRGARLVVAEEV